MHIVKDALWKFYVISRHEHTCATWMRGKRIRIVLAGPPSPDMNLWTGPCEHIVVIHLVLWVYNPSQICLLTEHIQCMQTWKMLWNENRVLNWGGFGLGTSNSRNSRKHSLPLQNASFAYKYGKCLFSGHFTETDWDLVEQSFCYSLSLSP